MKIVLFILVAFVAISATLLGLWMMSNPDGGIAQLPYSLLDGTPFTNFLLPGIILTLLIGGVNIFAMISNLQNLPNRYAWSIFGGFLTVAWVIMEIFLNRSAYWIEYVYLITGFLIILLAFQLKGKWVV